jgi:hypothetical protein
MFLTGKNFIKTIHKTTLPEKRPMDDVKLDQDFPQEEEFALLALSPYSYYQCYFFPRKTKEFFRLFSLVDPGYLMKWQHIYLFIIKKITFSCEGKQLILKNPVNTVRIRHLFRIFPEAKFIYLYRDPVRVLRSTFKLFSKFLPLYAFQEIDEQELRNNIRWVYDQTIAQYQDQKQLIAKHNLAEIRYEQFIQNPLNEVERIYRELKLDGFASAKNNFEKYIQEQSTYVPDQNS